MSVAELLDTSAGRSPGREPCQYTATGDLIFVSLENWDDIWRRNQFLCSRLAGRHPDARILFVGLPRNLLREWRQGRRRARRRPAETTVPGSPNITLTHAWEILPNRFRLGRWFNQFLARRHLQALASKLALRAPVLWLNAHDAAHLAGHLGESAVIYDVTDDWSQVSQPPARKWRTVREDERLCRRADAVIVCSDALWQSKTALSRHVHLVPNGVDALHYAGDSPQAKPPGAGLWRGKILGYTGTLHGDRLDVELVRRLASILGNTGSLVLIGPDHLSAAERERLRLPNIFLTGAVPYTRLPEYMRLFEACIVPHRVTPFTESLNPIKLWEYLALGKPIIATRVAGFRDYPNLVYLAGSAAEFAGWAGLAATEDPRLVQQRRGEAQRHSWERRCDAVERVIADCLARRAQEHGPASPTEAMTELPTTVSPDAATQKALDIAYHREAAATYDAVVTRNFHFFHVHSLHPWIARLCARLPEPEVLDLGTGTGVVAVTLARFGCHVTAMDHSPEMLDHARVRAQSAGVDHLLTFTLGDGEQLPYLDACFDAVTIQGVLHHLPDGLPMLREARRVLRPGGELYVSEPCAESTPVTRRLHALLAPARWARRFLLGRRIVEPAVSNHEAPVSGPQLVEQMRVVGFDVEVEYLVRTGIMQAVPEQLKIWVTLLLSWPTRRMRGDILFLVGTKR